MVRKLKHNNSNPVRRNASMMFPYFIYSASALMLLCAALQTEQKGRAGRFNMLVFRAFVIATVLF